MVTCSQADFLTNSSNKTKLIQNLKIYLEKEGVYVKVAKGDADALIVATALEKAKNKCNVTVVASDSDILVMLLARTPNEANVKFLMPSMGSKMAKLYTIKDIQNKIGDMKNHIIFVHTMTGCDTTSALYNKGKKKAWSILAENAVLKKTVDIFNMIDTNQDKIAEAGEKFMIELYNGRDCTSLDELRIYMYSRGIAKTAITTSFKLSTLPPTSASAHQHSLRVYHQTQQWLGNDLDASKCGWKLLNGKLAPQPTVLPPAPDELLHIISCNCKGSCNTRSRCECRRVGLQCSNMCGRCHGVCKNRFIDISLDEEDQDIEFQL